MTSRIELTQLPAPDVVHALDYETILAEMLADLRSRAPEFTALVESDPAYKILEVAAYREMLLRQRVNDAARSVMVAYARGADLDNLGALFGVLRNTVTPGDPEATPPVPAVLESDESYRQRIPLSLEGYSTAGPIGAYIFHALGASGEVKGVSVASPTPGQVVVSVLSNLGNGTASNALLNTVEQHLNHEDTRPLTDQVIVQGAAIIEYEVDATLMFFRGPDIHTVAEQARRKVQEYVTQQHALGRDITLSGLYAALHLSGVQKVILNSPATDIIVEENEAAFCSKVTVTVGGLGE